MPKIPDKDYSCPIPSFNCALDENCFFKNFIKNKTTCQFKH